MQQIQIKSTSFIKPDELSGEFYLTSLLQAAYAKGLLSDSDLENIQRQLLDILAEQCTRFIRGKSSSLRVECAESLLQSINYTLGLFLKSLPDPERAAAELKKTPLLELYQKGSARINHKKHTARHFYEMTMANKIITLNYTYNATLDPRGLGQFFRLYDADFAATEIPAVIDYQLFYPVTDLTGVEFIQKYLEKLYLENEFCSNFKPFDLHCLLYGFDAGYSDLLINIFEIVLTAALGCVLTERPVVKLDLQAGEVQSLRNLLAQDDVTLIAFKLSQAMEALFQELKLTSAALRKYLENSLPKITLNIIQAVKTDTLGKTIAVSVNPDLTPKIEFLAGRKMADADFRELIKELLICRHTADKMQLIKEKVKSFDDLEEVLLEARLSAEEIRTVFGMLDKVELAALLKRHPCQSEIQAVDLTEAETSLKLDLKDYLSGLPEEEQDEILELAQQLIEPS